MMNTFFARPLKAPHFANTVGGIYYSTQGHIHLQWSADRIQLADLQAFYEQALLLLGSTGCRKILSEHGQRQPLSAAAQHWITREWIPRAMKQVRAEYCAIVDGSNPMHRLSTQTVISDAPSDFIFKRFDTISEAEAWLGNLPR
jgi:hypothetical protein